MEEALLASMWVGSGVPQYQTGTAAGSVSRWGLFREFPFKAGKSEIPVCELVLRISVSIKFQVV